MSSPKSHPRAMRDTKDHRSVRTECGSDPLLSSERVPARSSPEQFTSAPIGVKVLAGAARSMLLSLVIFSHVDIGSAQPGASVQYCAELKELNNLAMSHGRFSPIIGPSKDGNYHETKLALAGWVNCAFYGRSTYTCDSPPLSSHNEAARTQDQIAQEILSCFEGTWAEAPEQMGPDFMVLHPKLGPASITLNLDQSDNDAHIVRLILFLRR